MKQLREEEQQQKQNKLCLYVHQVEASNSKLKQSWNLAAISGYQENYKKWGEFCLTFVSMARTDYHVITLVCKYMGGFWRKNSAIVWELIANTR